MDPRQTADPTSTQPNYRTEASATLDRYRSMRRQSELHQPTKQRKSRSPRNNQLTRTQPPSPREHRSPQGDFNMT
jgi:hypothetical protein